MSLALTNMRGAFLNCRFAVNGIQKALRSFGVTFRRLDTGFLPFRPKLGFTLSFLALDVWSC
jgi:hypothetical protein